MSWFADVAARVRSVFSDELGAVPPVEEQASLQRWGQRSISSNAAVVTKLTPAKVARALKSADNGYPSQLFKMLDEIEDRDLHLVAVLNTRKRAVANLSWELEPASDRRRDRKIAEQVTALVDQIGNLEDGMVDLLDSVSKGVAFIELPWERRNDLWVVPELVYRPQAWFRPDDEAPSEWRVLGDGGHVGVAMQPGRFIVHKSRAKSGVDVKAGLGRVLLWWYLFKSYSVKDWVSFLELYGAPLRLGKTPPGASDADIDKLYGALTQLGISATAVVPDGFDVQLIGAKAAGGGSAGNPPYEALIKMVERGMSKAVLGQTLTTEEGSNGARALGQVHNEVRQDLVESDAKQLASTLTRCLLAPLIQYNFGAGVPVPKWVFDTEPPADEKALAETQEVRGRVFLQAKALGLPVSVAQARRDLGIDEVRDGDQVLSQGAGDELTTEDEAELQDTDTDKPSGPGTQVEGRATRLSTPFCSIFSTSGDPLHAQAEQLLEQYKAGTTEAWGDLVDVVRKGMLEAGSPAAAKARFEALISELDLGELAGELADASLNAELVGRLQAKDSDGSQPAAGIPRIRPADAIDFWTEKGVVTRAQFDALDEEHRTRAFTMARFTTLGGLQSAYEAVEASIRDGETLGDFEARLDKAWAKDGLAPDKPWRVETAYRNNVFTALSVGRHREQHRPAAKARRPFGRYNHIGGAGRRAHIAMDGHVSHLDSDVWKVWGTPNGHGCRCYRTVHTAAELQQNGWAANDELPLDIGTGKPVVPDEGWRTNPALEPHEFDESGFPEIWRKALQETP